MLCDWIVRLEHLLFLLATVRRIQVSCVLVGRLELAHAPVAMLKEDKAESNLRPSEKIFLARTAV
jgi:hypothetical protein